MNMIIMLISWCWIISWFIHLFFLFSGYCMHFNIMITSWPKEKRSWNSSLRWSLWPFVRWSDGPMGQVAHKNGCRMAEPTESCRFMSFCWSSKIHCGKPSKQLILPLGGLANFKDWIEFNVYSIRQVSKCLREGVHCQLLLLEEEELFVRMIAHFEW